MTINQIARKYKSGMAVSIFSALLVGITGISFGKIVKSLIDNNVKDLAFYIILMLVMSFVFAFFSFIRSFYANLVAEKIAQDITFLLYDKLIKAKSEVIQNFSISYINIVLIEDIAKIKSFLASQISFFVRNCVMFVMGMILMIKTSVFLFFCLIFTAFLIVLLLALFLSIIKQYNHKVNDINVSIIKYISQGVLMQKTVQIFNPNDSASLNLKNKAVLYDRISKKKNIWRSLMFSAIIFLCLVSATLCVYYGINFVHDRSMTGGQFTSFLIYMLVVISSLIGISNFRQERESFVISKNKVEEILVLDEYGNGGIIPKSNDIVIDNLCYKNIFYNFSEKIENGKSTAVVGKSGIGKSTLIDLLLGFISSYKGDIMVGGEKINNIDIKYWHSIVSICPQNTELFDASVGDNIFYGIDFDKELYDKIVVELDLLKIKDMEANQLSVGEKQRICIARALLKKNASVFIFDEPTSALDIKNSALIFETIKRYTEKKTVIIITHDDKNLNIFDKVIKLD